MSSEFLQPLFIFLFAGIITVFSCSTGLEETTSRFRQIDTTAYTVVQVPPKFPGGHGAMCQFIESTSQYPINLKKGSLVLLRLLIEKDGSISRVELTYTNGNDQLVQEAKRIVRLMPKWTPGSQDGRLLRVYTSVPMRFVNGK